MRLATGERSCQCSRPDRQVPCRLPPETSSRLPGAERLVPRPVPWLSSPIISNHLQTAPISDNLQSSPIISKRLQTPIISNHLQTSPTFILSPLYLFPPSATVTTLPPPTARRPRLPKGGYCQNRDTLPGNTPRPPRTSELDLRW